MAMQVSQMCAVLVCSKAWQRYFEDVRDPWPWVDGWGKCPKQQLLVSSHPFTVSQQDGHLCYLVALHKICSVTINCACTFLTLFVVLCKTIPIYVVVPSILASFQTQSRMSRCAYRTNASGTGPLVQGKQKIGQGLDPQCGSICITLCCQEANTLDVYHRCKVDWIWIFHF